MPSRNRWPIGIAAVFGAWLFVSVFVLGTTGMHYWNDLVIGAVIAIAAAYSAYATSGNRMASGLATLLGLWAIVTPFVYVTTTTILWSDIIAGVVVAILAGYDTYTLGMMTEAEAETARPT